MLRSILRMGITAIVAYLGLVGAQTPANDPKKRPAFDLTDGVVNTIDAGEIISPFQEASAKEKYSPYDACYWQSDGLGYHCAGITEDHLSYYMQKEPESGQVMIYRPEGIDPNQHPFYSLPSLAGTRAAPNKRKTRAMEL